MRDDCPLSPPLKKVTVTIEKVVVSAVVSMEGTRPRLPWAIRIPDFIKNPKPVMPILDALKDDSELYVRERSIRTTVLLSAASA